MSSFIIHFIIYSLILLLQSSPPSEVLRLSLGARSHGIFCACKCGMWNLLTHARFIHITTCLCWQSFTVTQKNYHSDDNKNLQLNAGVLSLFGFPSPLLSTVHYALSSWPSLADPECLLVSHKSATIWLTFQLFSRPDECPSCVSFASPMNWALCAARKESQLSSGYTPSLIPVPWQEK